MDGLDIYSQEVHLSINDETPVLQIEQEPDGIMLGEMEGAYRYELWRCLQILNKMKTQIDTLEQSLETITLQQVQKMWA